MDLTAETVRQLLHYDPATGNFRWLDRPRAFFTSDRDWKWWNRRYSSAEAFVSIDGDGYRQARIFGRRYLAHRIAWLIQTGDWPAGEIDHINGVVDDNRFVNLRDVSTSMNQRNTKRSSRNTSGVTGVFWHRVDRRWHAQIRVNGVSMHIGSFHTREAAAAARLQANARHGFSARHGSSAPEGNTARDAALREIGR